MTRSMDQEGLNTIRKLDVLSKQKYNLNGVKSLPLPFIALSDLNQLWDGAPASSQLFSLQQNENSENI